MIFTVQFRSHVQKGFARMGWLVFVALLCTAACTKSDEPAKDNHIRIGVLASLTGAAASTGESSSQAVSLAVQNVNTYLESPGGNSIQVSFTLADTETDAARSLERLKDLYNQGIRHVIGPYASAEAAAVLEYANTNGITLLSPSSVATTLSIPGDNLFRLVPDDRNQAKAISALFGYDHIDYIIPVVRNDLWGEGLISEVTDLLTQQGKTVLSPVFYDPGNVTAGPIISEVAAAIDLTLQQTTAERTAVYLLSFGEGTSILSAASAAPSCALVRWYGSSAFAINASLIADNAGASFATQQSLRCPIFVPEAAAKDLWEPIVLQLTNQLGRTPESYALSAYDAVWLMALAYRDCTDPENPELFNASLEQTAAIFYGITGRTLLNAAGDRKFATFGFWGLSFEGGAWRWKEFGNYSASTGQLVIY